MTWVKLDDKASVHPKSLASGLEVFGLWVAGLCWCNGHNTDGKIEKHFLRGLFPSESVSLRELKRFAARLVETGRWIDNGDHWAVHDYEAFQEEALKERVEQRRAYERERKRQLRRRAAMNNSADVGQMSRRDSRGTVPTFIAGTNGGTTTADDSSLFLPSVSQAPDPSRPVPDKNTHTSESAADPVSPASQAILETLLSHKSLKAIATAAIAEELATNGFIAGKSLEAMKHAIGVVAAKAGVDAAAGRPWTIEAILEKVASYVLHARLPRPDAPRSEKRPIIGTPVRDTRRPQEPAKPITPEQAAETLKLLAAVPDVRAPRKLDSDPGLPKLPPSNEIDSRGQGGAA